MLPSVKKLLKLSPAPLDQKPKFGEEFGSMIWQLEANNSALMLFSDGVVFSSGEKCRKIPYKSIRKLVSHLRVLNFCRAESESKIPLTIKLNEIEFIEMVPLEIYAPFFIALADLSGAVREFEYLGQLSAGHPPLAEI